MYASSAGDSSDTSDADEAGSIEELLTPGDPVYFNDPLTNTLPPSIQVHTSYSLVPRLSGRRVGGAWGQG